LCRRIGTFSRQTVLQRAARMRVVRQLEVKEDKE
jgi:hypothetical protein